MGKLIQKLNIDACPNCGSEDFEMTSTQYDRPQSVFSARCSRCDIEYSIHYLSPGGSLMSDYVQRVEKDVFALFARNI